MKRLVYSISLLYMAASQVAVADPLEIPKSSLEAVKTVAEKNLEDAHKSGDTQKVEKYHNEVEQLKKKIEKFELEWLEDRRAQLLLKTDDHEAEKELGEIEVELAKRGSGK